MLPFPSERAGGTSKGASDHRRAAKTDDAELLQEAGGAQGEGRPNKYVHTLKTVFMFAVNVPV